MKERLVEGELWQEMAVKVKSKSEIKKVEIKYQIEKNGKKKSYKRKNCSNNAKESPF